MAMFSLCSSGVKRHPTPGRPSPASCDAPFTPHSGDDVGGNLVFDEGDAVAELQLALLQPLQAEQVRRRRLMQGIDRRVEIAVLLLQPGQFGLQHALVIVSHDACQLKNGMILQTAAESLCEILFPGDQARKRQATVSTVKALIRKGEAA